MTSATSLAKKLASTTLQDEEEITRVDIDVSRAQIRKIKSPEGTHFFPNFFCEFINSVSVEEPLLNSWIKVMPNFQPGGLLPGEKVAAKYT